MEYHFSTFPLLFTFLLFTFLLFRIHKKTKTPTNLPPGPWKLPLLGNLHNLIGHSLPHHRLRDLASKHGPVMHLQIGEIPTIVVSSPETAQSIMKTHDVIFAQRPHFLGIHILTYGSKGVVFSNGDYLRQVRKMCTTELLSPNRVKSFRSIREEEVGSMINSIYSSSSEGSPVNLTQRVLSLIYGITGRTIFGDKCKQQEEFISIATEGTKVVAGFGLLDIFPSAKLLHFVSGEMRKIEKLHLKCDVIVNDIIIDHTAYRKGSSEAKNRAHNLLGVLMDIQERGDLKIPLTTDNIKAIIQDMFGAGGETTSLAIDWAMAEMLKNPKIMNKAQTEVRKVFDTKGVVDEEGLQELTFLKCVIKETLRFHPPTPLLIPRECREQCKINGYDIPLKTKVIINAMAIGRDPRHWTEPERFYPERFLDSRVDFRGNDFEFVPFGAGRRICPGIAFAMPNLELPLASLLYHFDWELPNGAKCEDLDMSEEFGASVRRQDDLWLIAIPYRPQIA